jgi:hypothetical protein
LSISLLLVGVVEVLLGQMLLPLQEEAVAVLVDIEPERL